MGQIGQMLADAGNVGFRYALRLLKDIPADQFACFATPGNTVVTSNHPAFIVGHLALYPVKICEHLGVDSTSFAPPESYTTVFSKDAKCVDDRKGEVYPAKDELIDYFTRGYQAAMEALRNAADDQLLAENPVDTPMKNVCPSLGSMLGFYISGHVTTHLGQLSAWRRMQDLPPA